MLSKSYKKVLFSTLTCLILFTSSAYSQSYRFRNYGSENGIPSTFIYSIVQDNNGYLWVGTGGGLSKFDGFDFTRIKFPDSSVDRFPTVSLRDKNGVLWFGCNDGTVYFAEGSTLTQVPLNNERSVVSILEGPDKSIYIFPQNGSVIRVNPDDPISVKSFSLDPDLIVYSACFTQSGNLLLGTQDTLSICSISDDSLKVLTSISGFDYSNISAIYRIDDSGNYVAGTDGNGIFKLTLSGDNGIISRFVGSPEVEAVNVQSISGDSENNLWVSTNGSGVIQMKFSGSGEISSMRFYNQNSGLKGNNARIVYQDMESNYWIGLFGDGLSILNSLAFRIYLPGTSTARDNIIYVNKINNEYLLGTPSGYWLFDPETEKTTSFVDLKEISGKYEILSYCVDSDNNIWIGTNGGGLFLRDSSGRIRLYYRNGNTSEDNVTDIEVDNKYIWLGTLNGVVLLDKGNAGQKFRGRYNYSNGLPHNGIRKIFLTPDGKAVIAMVSERLFTIDPVEGVIKGTAIMIGTIRNEIISFCQSGDRHLWASTKGNGVFEFFDDSLRSYSRSNLLLSDFCYSIIADPLDRIWIGHDGGFSVYDRKSGTVRTYGNDYTGGGLCNPDGMYQSPDGKIFIGTTQGFLVYDIKNDLKPKRAPLNNINYVTINDSVYPLRSTYTLPYSKRYKIVVNYVGINLRDPEKVYYQTMLENYDYELSEVTTKREVYFTPGDGRYRFIMKSVNDYGLSDENPVVFQLYIKRPFWRTWWFILSGVAAIAAAVVLIVRQREKEQKRIQAYLEKELEARTSVVMKQKDKIELQNIEITDSINYAKRIQSSILPDFARVEETFKDAFLFFKPRDIVSGDFYWFDKFSDDKFILVCADSTGHGVPGAFMSMIGSTILQDIVTRQRITKPSVILKMLDRQIFSTLNQNVELGVSNDGMDMVICEINIKKRHIRFSSAMRPVILVLDGEPVYVKGNRCSVGGESVIEKFFDDQEYYLNNGDSIYLFSDGLPDQFGGTDGKKMKIARLKKLIEDVNSLPMPGQKEVISKFYEEWKGDYDQVDDILMIGVSL
jgi:ligand-binding sensor domain-containing protein/serine phosphatase RsbU (regulator of sigma subunit)